MKDTGIDTHHNNTVTDKLIELAHAVSQQGTLSVLTDDQLKAIACPDSIVGLVTLLNAVDKASQAEILLEDPTLLALVSSSQINTLAIMSVAPQCAKQLCVNVGTTFTPCGGWLAEVIK
ncbi:MAG: hypothetical protein M3R00_05425 [Pseudomonadota bacterium]|nr:hypothetical protein [Pseudomonadota bacterium]